MKRIQKKLSTLQRWIECDSICKDFVIILRYQITGHQSFGDIRFNALPLITASSSCNADTYVQLETICPNTGEIQCCNIHLEDIRHNALAYLLDVEQRSLHTTRDR